MRADDERWLGQLRRAALVLLALGVAAFLIRGATRPADPVLESSGRRPLAGFGEVAVQVVDAAGNEVDWCALLASTEVARAQGLMGQRDLRGYDAMVFRFDGPTDGRFYMYKTLLPLSIAFLDPSGAFVSAADMTPCQETDPGRCETFGAAGPYLLAVEVPVGELGEVGLGPGSKATFLEGGCPA